MKTTIRFSMPAILFAVFSVFFTNCIKDATIPVVSTNEATEVTQTTATSGGVISSDGGATVTARGVCWSTNQNPTIADNKTTDGTGAGSFTSPMTGLTANTKYYVRAYATNSTGTWYGNARSFITLEGNLDITYGTVTDIDGNTYKTVKIGTQTWMAENLKVTKYNNGIIIPNVTDGNRWYGLTSGAYCNYNNSPSNVATYGRLYNWYAVKSGKLCPTGWHVATDAEWMTLINYLGGEEVAGNKLKETDTIHWHSPNTGATNESGFTALPGGCRDMDGTFKLIGLSGWWWSATQFADLGAISHYISYYYGSVEFNYDYQQYGYSVRCVKN
ncbi:MAG: fibrobacter succinogenes major paralogous domain-containing protein [Bacteroidales bacterium]|nr:fibrobacter succinogenes major paralogous domain-containing protein [Bacteroidales bacterium]